MSSSSCGESFESFKPNETPSTPSTPSISSANEDNEENFDIDVLYKDIIRYNICLEKGEIDLTFWSEFLKD